MNEHMKDRGPDARGIWQDPARRVSLGHVRLAIQDLSANGAQPMLSHSGRSVMVYNGEVYNAADLKADLAGTGCGPFRGTSDTEILLEHAEAFGLAKTLEKSVGMFAIALYDIPTGTLSLARDRVGEKPLYYGFSGDTFAFASDVGAFREIPGFANGIRRDILPFYFSHGYIPAPYSIYEDVWKLEPGTILTLDPPYTRFDPRKDGDVAWYYRQTRAGEMTSASGHAYQLFYSMKETAAEGQARPFAGSRQEASEELARVRTYLESPDGARARGLLEYEGWGRLGVNPGDGGQSVVTLSVEGVRLEGRAGVEASRRSSGPAIPGWTSRSRMPRR